MPNFIHSSTSFNIKSAERRKMPGIEATSTRLLLPSSKKIGKIRSSVLTRVSSTMARMAALFRFRLGLRLKKSDTSFEFKVSSSKTDIVGLCSKVAVLQNLKKVKIDRWIEEKFKTKTQLPPPETVRRMNIVGHYDKS